ncbi:uncharacterized protein EHS24_003362 [Apiotrichum porosum]|uniref:Uncharacterized protein n=1 Tax=Apiotrichum porosum TaxID=105984 RepID=A0A427XER7_9TREE|nr:uncharacterized protein EHS24_003362 [Apiotrichum porosum]RSH77399.1 hypothetical protein EHS24_003362 [Apiotrichum porosum]
MVDSNRPRSSPDLVGDTLVNRARRQWSEGIPDGVPLPPLLTCEETFRLAKRRPVIYAWAADNTTFANPFKHSVGGTTDFQVGFVVGAQEGHRQGLQRTRTDDLEAGFSSGFSSGFDHGFWAGQNPEKIEEAIAAYKAADLTDSGPANVALEGIATAVAALAPPDDTWIPKSPFDATIPSNSPARNPQFQNFASAATTQAAGMADMRGLLHQRPLDTAKTPSIPSSLVDPNTADVADNVTRDPHFQHFANAATSFAAQLEHAQPEEQVRHAGRDVPEKCWSWSTQQAGKPSTVHMFCARKDLPPQRADELANLRPVNAPVLPKNAPPGFFERLRNRVAPWTLIYVRGTSEGVAGRYSEELEGDDGQYDFGPLSRHAPQKLRREAGPGAQFLNWEEDGCLIYLPIYSVIFPLLNLDIYSERVFGPSSRMFQRYIQTFEDGTQTRMLHKVVDNVRDGGALQLWNQIGDFHARKLAKAREALAARKLEEEALARAAAGNVSDAPEVGSIDGNKAKAGVDDTPRRGVKESEGKEQQ